MYAQVSFFHGFVEFDMTKKDDTGGDYGLGAFPSRRPASSPGSSTSPSRTRSRTCRASAARYVEGAQYSKPYWAVEGPGNTCWMSMSGSDLVTIISFGKEKVVAEVAVGDHPQRVRQGRILESIVADF